MRSASLIRRTFLVLCAFISAVNVVVGVCYVLLAIGIAIGWMPAEPVGGADARPHWVSFTLVIGAFLVVLGATGLYGTYKLAQRWNVVPRASDADTAIRERAFRHWKLGASVRS